MCEDWNCPREPKQYELPFPRRRRGHYRLPFFAYFVAGVLVTAACIGVSKVAAFLIAVAIKALFKAFGL